jgi:hypothetical protein
MEDNQGDVIAFERVPRSREEIRYIAELPRSVNKKCSKLV